MSTTSTPNPFWLRGSERVLLAWVLAAFWAYVIATKLIVRAVWLGRIDSPQLAPLADYALQHALMVPVLVLAYLLALRLGLPARRRTSALLAQVAIVVAIGILGRYSIFFATMLLEDKRATLAMFAEWVRRDLTNGEWLWLIAFTEFTFQYLCGLGIAAAIVGWRRYHVQALVRDAQEHELTRARLAALRRQIDPHFLFNTLNSIAARLPDDAAGANDMLMRTARLLRRTTDDERECVPLSEELQVAREYLELHAQRFPDRLRVAISLAPQLDAVEVPALLLQPLVENAALHGLASDAPQVAVQVSAQPATATDGSGLIRIEITNTARMDAPLPDPAQSSGVGLRNTWARLQATYGERFALGLMRLDGAVMLRLDLPVEHPERA
ncbi:MAG: histidine kinase [Steroidobacteraceae bacterium]